MSADGEKRGTRRLKSIRWKVLTLLCSGIFAASLLVLTAFAQCTEAYVPDAALANALLSALGKTQTDSLCVEDLETIQNLQANQCGISDLTGLEHCTSLVEVDLIDNDIATLLPIAGLSNLQALRIDGNPISDLEGVQSLLALEELGVGFTNVSDLTPVSQLLNLVELAIDENPVASLAPLATLASLRVLGMFNTHVESLDGLEGCLSLEEIHADGACGQGIRDISALSQLPNLRIVNLLSNNIDNIDALATLPNLEDVLLAGNEIEDISPLVDNPSLSAGDFVDLTDNRLNVQCLNTPVIQDIRELRSRGVQVLGASPEEQRGPDPVQIPDPGLREALEDALGKSPADPIYQCELENLESLIAESMGIQDIEVLQFCSNLRVLWLIDNPIRSLSALAGLANLEWLVISGSGIEDISPLAGLMNLEVLWLPDNPIQDLSALAGLGKLEKLFIDGIGIEDISPLAGLMDLRVLWLDNNPIQNLSAISNLVKLEKLSINWTNVASLESLRTLFSLRELWVVSTQVQSLAGLEGCQSLEYLCALGDNGSGIIRDISALSALVNLTDVRLRFNDIVNIDALGDLPNLENVELDGNEIEDISPLASNLGIAAGDVVRLADNRLNVQCPNTPASQAIQALRDRGVEVLGASPEEQRGPEPVQIPDPGLRDALEDALGKSPAEPIYECELEGLEILEALSMGIRDIEGLQYCRNLQVLHLSSNPVQDLSALGNLVKLETLDITMTDVTSLVPLSSLSNLTCLELDSTPVEDLTGLECCSALTFLNINDTNVSDLTPVSQLADLVELWINDTPVVSLLPLATLTSLRILGMCGTLVESLDGLEGCTSLEALEADDACIRDIASLSNTVRLTSVGLDSNEIDDISPLVENPGLGVGTYVHLSGNRLNFQCPNTPDSVCVAALQERGVIVSGADALEQEGPAPVQIPDPGLREALENALGKSPGDPIYECELEMLTELNALGRAIRELAGLENCTSLRWLELGCNQVSDLSPISGLPALEELYLQGNALSDEGFGTLTNVDSLSTLDVGVNDLTGLVHLLALPSVQWVNVTDNNISSLSGIEALESLEYLEADLNPITSVEPLTGLTLLENLTLGSTLVSDLSPLSSLIGLRWLEISGSLVASLQPISACTALEELYACETLVSSLAGLESLDLLRVLEVDDCGITSVDPLVLLTNLEFVSLAGNLLDLQCANTPASLDIQTLKDRGVEVLGASPEEQRGPDPVQIPDPGLREALENALGKSPGDPIYECELGGLEELLAYSMGIEDIEGLQYCENLQVLSLVNNPLASYSCLASLGMLRVLSLYGCGIEDISPLAGLMNLRHLGLGSNPIQDLSALAAHRKLEELVIDHTDVTNLEPLAALSALQELWMVDTQVRSLAGLEGCLSLESLHAEGFGTQRICDISALNSLPNLAFVNLVGNEIGRIDALATPPNLVEVLLAGNEIEDISPLVDNPSLSAGDFVDLVDNRLDVQCPDTPASLDIQALRDRGVDVLGSDPEEQRGPAWVEFSDPVREAVVRAALGKGQEEPIYQCELDGLPQAMAYAGPDMEVLPGQFVCIEGDASIDPADSIISWEWTQVSGFEVDLLGSDTRIVAFYAPERLCDDEIIVLELQIRTSLGWEPQPDAVEITFLVPEPIELVCPEDIDLEWGASEDTASTGIAEILNPGNFEVDLWYEDARSGSWPEVIERTWYAEDECGNVVTCTQRLTIIDSTPPVIICPPDVQVEAGESTEPGSTGEATAIDDRDPNPQITHSDSSSSQCPEVITRTWHAEDSCGNVASATQTITIIDTTPPTIACPPDRLFVSAEEVEPECTGEATASDLGDAHPVVTYVDLRTGVCQDVITRTWYAEDACGNRASCSQRITIADETPLSIVWPDDVTVLRTAVNDLELTGEPVVTAAADSSYTVHHLDIPSPRGTCPDSIYRVWSVMDECEHSSSRGQTITILTSENAPPRYPVEAAADRDPTTYRTTVSWISGDPDGDAVRYRVYIWSDDPVPARLAGEITTDAETVELELRTAVTASYMRWRIEASDGCLQVESEEFVAVLSPVVVRSMSLVEGDTPHVIGPSLCHDGQGQVEFDLSGGLPPYVWTLHREGDEYLSGSEPSRGDVSVPIEGPGEYALSVTDSMGNTATKALKIEPEVNGCRPYPPTQLTTGINAGDPAFVSFWWEGGEPGGGVVYYEFAIVEINSAGEPVSDPERFTTWQSVPGTVGLGALFLNHGSTYEWYVVATAENGLSASSLDLPPHEPARLEIVAAEPAVEVALSSDYEKVSPATTSPLRIEVSNTGNCTSSFEIEIRAQQGDLDEVIATVKSAELRPGEAWQTTIAPLLPPWLAPGSGLILKAIAGLSEESSVALGDVRLMGTSEETAELGIDVNSPPEVTLLSPPNGASGLAAVGTELEWESHDPDGDATWDMIVLYSEGAKNPLFISVPQGQKSWTLPFLEAGASHTWNVISFDRDPNSAETGSGHQASAPERWEFRTSTELPQDAGTAHEPTLVDLYKEYHTFHNSLTSRARYSEALAMMGTRDVIRLAIDGTARIALGVLLESASIMLGLPGIVTWVLWQYGLYDLGHWAAVEVPDQAEEIGDLNNLSAAMADTPVDLSGYLVLDVNAMPVERDLAYRIVHAVSPYWKWDESQYGFYTTRPADYSQYFDQDSIPPSAVIPSRPGTLFYYNTNAAVDESSFLLVWNYLYNRFPEVAELADSYYTTGTPFLDASFSGAAFLSDPDIARAEEGAREVDRAISSVMASVASVFRPNGILDDMYIGQSSVAAGTTLRVETIIRNPTVYEQSYLLELQAVDVSGSVVSDVSTSFSLGEAGSHDDQTSLLQEIEIPSEASGSLHIIGRLFECGPLCIARGAELHNSLYPAEIAVQEASSPPILLSGQQLQDLASPGDSVKYKLRLENPALNEQAVRIEVVWSEDSLVSEGDPVLASQIFAIDAESSKWVEVEVEIPMGAIPGKTYRLLAYIAGRLPIQGTEGMSSSMITILPDELLLRCNAESESGGVTREIRVGREYKITWILEDFISLPNGTQAEIRIVPGYMPWFRQTVADTCSGHPCVDRVKWFESTGSYTITLELWDGSTPFASYVWMVNVSD